MTPAAALPANFARRGFCSAVAAGALLSAAGPAGAVAARGKWTSRFAALEPDTATRFGACILDMASGRAIGWRANERFAMCSSFKLSLAAMVLSEADAGRLKLAEHIDFGVADLLDVSPVTKANLGKGMTLAALAEAALVTSDNAAANLLLRRLGGPGRLTRFWRGLGDRTTRLDRIEPELNSVLPGDPRDTTTPGAMARTLSALIGGPALSPASRAMLAGWMTSCQTGLRRIRAGLPQGWQAGDKTGTGLFGNRPSHYVDIAVATSPSGRRFAITGFVTTSRPQSGIDPALEALLARIGEIAVAWADETGERP